MRIMTRRHHLILWPTLLLLLAVAAGAVLPLHSVRRTPCGPSLGRNMNLIVSCMHAYAAELPTGSWPPDEQTLIAWSDGDVSEQLFMDPRDPDLTPAMLYVRPIPTARTSQPVLISNPRCTVGNAFLVAYADGHIERTKDLSLWHTAQRLARSPKALAEGISPEDWGIPTTKP